MLNGNRTLSELSAEQRKIFFEETAKSMPLVYTGPNGNRKISELSGEQRKTIYEEIAETMPLLYAGPDFEGWQVALIVEHLDLSVRQVMKLIEPQASCHLLNMAWHYTLKSRDILGLLNNGGE